MSRRFAKKTKLFFTLLFCGVLVGAATVFWPSNAKALVTVGTSVYNNPTSFSGQRKVLYDPVTAKYWAFYYGNSGNCGLFNSPDGSTWSSATGGCSSAMSGSDFSVWLDRNGGAVYEIIKYSGASNYYQVLKGTLSASSISWSAGVNIYTIASGESWEPGLLISQDGNGRIWALYPSFITASGTTTIRASRSTNIDNITTWDTPITVYSSTAPSSAETGGLVPLTTAGDMYILVHPSTASPAASTIRGYKYTFATSLLDGGTTVDTLTANSTLNYNNGLILSAVAGANNTVHAVYVTGAATELVGTIRYAYYSSGSWGTPVTLDSGTTNTPPTISIDTAGKLYAIWPTASPGNLRYKIGDSPYGAANWSGASTLGAGAGIDNYPVAAYNASNGVIPVIWTNGTGPTYSVLYDTITATSVNSAPDMPTLSQPSSGAAGVSASPQFQLRTTDVDNDYLRYDVTLYQSDCSTLVRDIDQTGDQTGWTGQDQQTNTAYTGSSTISGSTMATHNYQNPALSASTTYCWKARAKDPGGSNTWGSYSATQTFTTGVVGPSVQIQGGVEIRGGTSIGN